MAWLIWANESLIADEGEKASDSWRDADGGTEWISVKLWVTNPTADVTFLSAEYKPKLGDDLGDYVWQPMELEEA